MSSEWNGRHVSRINGLSDRGADEIDGAEADVNERFQYETYGMQGQPCQEGDGKTTSVSPIVFQGGMTDSVAPTVRFEARDFNPAVGRWMELAQLKLKSGG